MHIGMVNSTDPREQSDQGLHCLIRHVCLDIWDHFGNLWRIFIFRASCRARHFLKQATLCMIGLEVIIKTKML